MDKLLFVFAGVAAATIPSGGLCATLFNNQGYAEKSGQDCKTETDDVERNFHAGETSFENQPPRSLLKRTLWGLKGAGWSCL
jgi:hypothetical protein